MRSLAIPVALLAAACVISHAQGGKPNTVLSFSFEKTSQPWQTLDPEGKVGLAADDVHVREGTSSLEFSYPQRAGLPGAQGMPGSLTAPIEGGLGGVKSLHFSVRAARAMPLVAGLSTGNGVTYTSAVWVPADTWLDVDLPVSGFGLGWGNEHPEANAHLVPEQVSNIVLIDATPFLLALSQSGVIPVSKPAIGQQTIWLDDVQFNSDALPAETPAHPVADGEPIIIDTCRHKFAQWVCLGGESPAVSEAAEGNDGPGLRVAYKCAAGTILALFHPFGQGLMQDAKRVEISLKVSSDSHVGLMFEQNIVPKPATGDGKSRYTHFVDLKAADGWQRLSLPLTDFNQGANETPNPMNPAMFSSLAVIDLSGANMGGQPKPVDNVIQIDDVVAVK